MNLPKKIKYKSGYKYQLSCRYIILTEIRPVTKIDIGWIVLDKQGVLKIRKGYAWDGPSGPTIDTKTFMRGSLVHDSLYQLMRHGYSIRRKEADLLLKKICREDGMCRIRAWWVYKSVRAFGSYAAKIENKREIMEAP